MGKQMVFGFENEDLGEVIGPKEFFLFNKALLLLRAQEYYLDCDDPDEQPVEGFFCCLCPAGIGELQLNRVVYLLRGEEHFGNAYEYGCNNCAALFRGAINFSGKPFTFKELNSLIQQKK